MSFFPSILGLGLGLSGAFLVINQQRLPTLSPEQREVLRHMSIVYLPDGQGGECKTIRISGVNVQVVNGLGATNGQPLAPDSTDPFVATTNCVGNLIVGYNELRGGLDDRTGSHNLVVGRQQDYSSYGGLVGGRASGLAAPFGVALGCGVQDTVGCGCDDFDGDSIFGQPGCGTPVDCDDFNPSVFPGAAESCNGIDDDCDGLIDEDQPDLDGDGFPACMDCNDTDSSTFPGAAELCDGVDNDCDGAVDEDC